MAVAVVVVVGVTVGVGVGVGVTVVVGVQPMRDEEDAGERNALILCRSLDPVLNAAEGHL
jgi:hypothetical protein